ncbi:MAG: hypothetical protein K0S80_4009, partial [Neobacillus sp.]|nr:hypothetical protein [Neobacillus sp.]
MNKKLASVFMASTIFAGVLAGCAGGAKEGSGGSNCDRPGRTAGPPESHRGDRPERHQRRGP